MSDDFWSGFFTAFVLWLIFFCAYQTVEYNRAHLYAFADRTCVVQWNRVTTCYPTPGVE